jgi:hypothetical protein
MRMRRKVGVVELLSVAAMLAASLAIVRPAQAQTPATRACGAGNIEFSVKEDPNHPAMPQTPAGKAMVVFAVDGNEATLATFTAKIGVDGKWAAATRAHQYISFAVDPGSHHLCASLQGAALMNTDNPVTLHSLQAEAGKTYYFRIRVYRSGDQTVNTSLDAIDEDEGQWIVWSTPRSLFKIK